MSKKETENSGARGKSAEVFSEALEALRRGEVIVFPTETLYGLGADALNRAAVEQVFGLKGRDPHNPIPIIIADEVMLRSVVSEIPPIAQQLIEHFWPGPLTLILTAKKGLPVPLLNRDGGVGVRISSRLLARRLTKELGHPLTATSANPSGREPARTADEAATYFSDKIKIFLDGGKLTAKKGSTVADVTGNQIRILREGEISRSDLEQALRASS